MDMDVTYHYLHDVSYYEYKDTLKLNFIGRRYFPAEDGQTFPPEESIVL